MIVSESNLVSRTFSSHTCAFPNHIYILLLVCLSILFVNDLPVPINCALSYKLIVRLSLRLCDQTRPKKNTIVVYWPETAYSFEDPWAAKGTRNKSVDAQSRLRKDA